MAVRTCDNGSVSLSPFAEGKTHSNYWGLIQTQGADRKTTGGEGACCGHQLWRPQENCELPKSVNLRNRLFAPSAYLLGVCAELEGRGASAAQALPPAALEPRRENVANSGAGVGVPCPEQ